MLIFLKVRAWKALEPSSPLSMSAVPINGHNHPFLPTHTQAYPQLEVVTAGLIAAFEQGLACAKAEATAASTATAADSGPSSCVMVAEAFVGAIKPLAAAYASYAGAYEEASQVCTCVAVVVWYPPRQTPF